jgi:hypothetical protein
VTGRGVGAVLVTGFGDAGCVTTIGAGFDGRVLTVVSAGAACDFEGERVTGFVAAWTGAGLAATLVRLADPPEACDGAWLAGRFAICSAFESPLLRLGFTPCGR